ncbi:deleted in malignant brain tumors 1 protein-like [Colossoma macropomum]|uniref:deleted in malignant brain tumors 1 protein-like n=1 Tax=Colossoma macropomum TaxID=42526 RepID=UPI0018650409|nr:deleted in malignant brain tumors 1 protein-like [Colossoma macropomum]
MLTAVILMTICSTADMTGVRLVDGDDQCSGIPEVLHEGEWWGVFSYFFLYRDAVLFCRELDCGNAVSVSLKSDFRGRNEKECILISEDQKSSISEYQTLTLTLESNFLNTSTVLVCSDSVRLVDGAGRCSGRVEVKFHQSWASVCESDFDQQDAEVVCRELGCGTPQTLQGALFGEGKHQFGTKEFQCEGTENRLLTCSTSDREENTCTHGKAVGLTCSGPEDVRLVDGSSRCAGTVMFYSGEWRRVGSQSWSMREAAVVCRQLDCGSAVSATKRVSSETGWSVYIGCKGSESALRECSIMNTFEIKFLGRVMCSGLLVKPSISFSTPIRVSRGLQGPEVFRGHSFTITCSTQPQYPGGSFHLKLPWTRSNDKAAVNHSASFLFPAADDSHQGSYSCVYENKEVYQFENEIELDSGSFVPTFFSESEPISIIVTDSPLPEATTRMLLVPLLLLTICLFIFLASKKWGHVIMRIQPGNKRAAAVQSENIEMNSLQPNAEEP